MRCLFIHDTDYGSVVTYNIEGIEKGVVARDNSTSCFTTRQVCPFAHDITVIDRNKHIYRITFVNADNQSWYVDITNNNNGVRRINFDNGRVHLIVGCADFFPEMSNDPAIIDKARARILYLEGLKEEKDHPEENEESKESEK